MLATVNVAVLVVWLVAEVIPLLADALAEREGRPSVSDDD